MCLFEAMNGVDIEDLKVAESSKRILKKLLEIVNSEEDSEIKDKLLKMHKLNLRLSRKIILDHQAKEALANFKKTKDA